MTHCERRLNSPDGEFAPISTLYPISPSTSPTTRGRNQKHHESCPVGRSLGRWQRLSETEPPPVSDGQGIGRTLSSPPPVLSAEDKSTRYLQIDGGLIAPCLPRSVNHSRPLRSTSALSSRPVPPSITFSGHRCHRFHSQPPSRMSCVPPNAPPPYTSSPALW